MEAIAKLYSQCSLSGDQIFDVLRGFFVFLFIMQYEGNSCKDNQTLVGARTCVFFLVFDARHLGEHRFSKVKCWCPLYNSLLFTLQRIPAQMPADSTNVSLPGDDFATRNDFAAKTKLQGHRI